ncbi:MAG: hypothetical protein DMG33_11535 [Acidobacteria bacterium]|nr:MAG: hypothetical protein DMG33_11535 [Acidobacteriota bacterium]
MCPAQRLKCGPRMSGSVLIGVLCALVLPARAEQSPKAEVPPPVQAQMDDLASRVAALLHRPGLRPPNPNLLIVDFSLANSTHISRLGTLLADQLSNSLGRLASGFLVLDRKPIPDFLRQNWMEPADLSDADASLWAARQLGANGVIHGQIAQVKDSMIRLSLRIDGLGPTFYSDQEFTLNDPLTQLLKEDAPYIPLEPEPIPPEPGVFAPGQEGVSTPVCEYCPDADYTDIARLLHYNGSVILSVVVGVDGKVTGIKVVKGAPYGLTKQAVDVLARWRLKPVQKDGKPVPVRVNVETLFHVSP